jgi:hypothetical protein
MKLWRFVGMLALAIAAGLGAKYLVRWWYGAPIVAGKEEPLAQPGCCAGIDAMFQQDTDRILDWKARQPQK